MTTIAWDGTTLVTDSMQSCGGRICGKAKKIFFGNGFVYAGCGAFQDIQAVFNWLDDPANNEKPLVNEGFAALVITTGVAEELNDSLILFESVVPNFMGSGADIAAGAYDVCNDIKKAVETACKLSTCSSLPLQIYSVLEDA